MNELSIDSIRPPDCFARAERIAGEVELVRLEMGRPRDARPPVTVAGASPREVWFEALALFRKTERLRDEIARDSAAKRLPAPPLRNVLPGHVLLVLDAVLGELAAVKTRLGIAEAAPEPARDDARQPSDVLGSIATTTRQVNLLLGRPFAPSDVYEVVSLAVEYAARLLDAPAPAPPELERRKRPADVYDRLLGCLDTVRVLLRAGGHDVISSDPARGDADDVLPSDVYDLATLVLGEIVFLHSQQTDRVPPYLFEFRASGHKLPAHVYQLAGLLQTQLAALASG